MAAPPNELAFDYDVTKQAAENWRARKPEREQKARMLEQKRYDAVEPKERLAKHANRLLDKVKKAPPLAQEAMSAGLKELVQREPITADEIDNDLMERVIGETRDFLSIDFLDRALRASRCVGRIVTRLAGGRVGYGTGFLVAPRLLLTNHHVLRSADWAANSAVELDYQLDLAGKALAVHRFDLDPGAFFLTDEGLDFALVAVREASADGKPLRDYGWCPLLKEEGKIITGNCVNIIQHPRGEMKQVVLRENKLVDLLDVMAHYQGDTEPGSSGSPAFSDQWEVVALHHSGVPKTDAKGNFLDAGGRVWKKGDDPARLAWVANEGVRVSRLADFLAHAAVRPREEKLRNGLWVTREALPPRDEHETNGGLAVHEPTVPHSVRHPSGAVTVTVPLQITVSLGAPGLPAAAAPVEAGAGAGALESGRPDPDDPEYRHRPGYDPNFLGFSAPLPKLSPALRPKAFEVPGAVGPNKYELKYHHYSVLFNRERRLAFVAAVNFDAGAPAHYERAGKDRWFFDPRVDEALQAGEEFYTRNPLDRGHLVRRADAAWGATEDEAKLANDDTFHFTNCSPQHEVFNQATKADQRGVLLWGNLEEHVARQARAGTPKVCVFNGPVFRANDRKHRGLPVPKEFWKVVAFAKDGGRPAAVAFVLSQEGLIKDLPAEEFEVGPYRPFQVKVRALEARTKLDFGALRDHDPLEDEANEAFFEAGTEFVPLQRAEDVVL